MLARVRSIRPTQMPTVRSSCLWPAWMEHLHLPKSMRYDILPTSLYSLVERESLYSTAWVNTDSRLAAIVFSLSAISSFPGSRAISAAPLNSCSAVSARTFRIGFVHEFGAKMRDCGGLFQPGLESLCE